jgi:hypothetical protein
MSPTLTCRHTRTRLIAKDKDAEYVECLDCGALLEAGELLMLLPPESEGPEGPRSRADSDESAADESLSDA